MDSIELSKLSKKNLIGIIIAVVVIFAGLLTTVSLINRSTSSTQTQTTNSITPTTHSGSEGAESGHGAQITQAHQDRTSKNPWGVVVDSAHGFIWVAEPGCSFDPLCPKAIQGTIGKYSLADGTNIMDYAEPQGFSSPMFLAVDTNGNVWFTEPNGDAIGVLNPNTNAWNQYKLPKGSGPYDLVIDRNDNIWFTLHIGNAIGFLNTQTHQIAINVTYTPNSNPYGITIDGKGDIWFAENGINAENIASFTPNTTGKVNIIEHAVTSAGLKQTIRPHLMTVDKAGHIWYSSGFAGAIGEFDPATGNSKNFLVTQACPTQACTHISGIAADKNGKIWFTDSLGGRVGYLDPASGRYYSKTMPKADTHPHDGLAVDNYNTMWYTEQNGFSLTMWPGAKLY
jgi:streptogramin lyase